MKRILCIITMVMMMVTMVPGTGFAASDVSRASDNILDGDMGLEDSIFDKDDEPEQPVQPEQPGTPDTPNTPNTPEEPEPPEIPQDPEEPDQPVKPDQPVQPEQPDTPDDPEQPEQPDTPDDPEQPEQPDTPDDPDQPAVHEHQLVTDPAVAATFDKSGLTEGSHCSECGEVIVKQNTVAKIGTVALEKNKYTYNGKVKKPAVTVKDASGKKISADNYTVSYASGRKNVGRYKVTVTFKKAYAGTKALYFTVVPKAPGTASARLVTGKDGYNDIKFTWSKSSGASGYYVYYKKSTAAKYTFMKRTTGTSVTKKNLAAGAKYTFKVVPYYKTSNVRYSSLAYKTAYTYTLKKLPAPKVTRNGAKVKVKWNNINGETGYQISKSTKRNGTNIVATYKTTKGNYKNISAAKGKKFYYKVRAYKSVKIGNKFVKVYGPWSKVKEYKR